MGEGRSSLGTRRDAGVVSFPLGILVFRGLRKVSVNISYKREIHTINRRTTATMKHKETRIQDILVWCAAQEYYKVRRWKQTKTLLLNN